MAAPIIGRTDGVVFESNADQVKDRDVWWCWLVNEPAMIVTEAPKHEPRCPRCQNGFLSPYKNSETHTFIAHIVKPNV